MEPLIVVLASRLDIGQEYVFRTWKVFRIEGQDRASVLKNAPPLEVAISIADQVPTAKENLIPLRIVTTEEQLCGLEIAEMHIADGYVSSFMIKLAETRKRQ